LLSRVVTNNAPNNTPRPKKNDARKTRGEILIEDLPPIQDLQINVPAEECIELGKVSSIVDQLGMW
jgi:H/ACA ribonucleoprotein complex non-core subunit NAF1